MSINIREASLGDFDAIWLIESSSQQYPYSIKQLQSCFSHNYINLVACSEQSLQGFVLCYQNIDFWEIHNICVANSARRQGVAKRLIQNLLERARSSNKRQLVLEVRQSNTAALTLYHQLGFFEVSRRKNYYPTENQSFEDAILMNCDISGKL